MPVPTRSALCLVVRDEVSDVTEWLTHHAAIGFDHIFVYDNGSVDGTTELLEELEKFLPLSLCRWPGDAPEATVAAYEDCIARAVGDYAWLTFFDVDEFLIPPPGGTVADLLDRMADHQSFVINRLTFGSSGLRHLDHRLVMVAFTRRGQEDEDVNAVVRSFVRPEFVREVLNPHLITTKVPAVTLAGRPARFSPERPNELMSGFLVRADYALHHYATRSDEHWLRRLGLKGRRGTFAEGDLNAESDTAALPFAAQAAATMNSRLAPILARHVVPRRTRSPLIDPANVLCTIDELSPRRVRGWLFNGADPLMPPLMNVMVDDVLIGTFAPDLPREDVATSGVPGLRVGFCFRIPWQWFDGAPHRLRVFVEGGVEATISRLGEIVAECEFSEYCEPQPLESSLDGIDGVHARGWVLREGEPTGLMVGGVEVLITCEGRTVGRYTADQPRPDVGALFGDAANPLRCGFIAYIPKAFRKSEEQVFRVVTIPEGIDLAGSPLSVGFL